MKTTSKINTTSNENRDDLKNDDNLKNENDLKNEDALKNEDNPKNEDNLKNDGIFLAYVTLQSVITYSHHSFPQSIFTIDVAVAVSKLFSWLTKIAMDIVDGFLGLY